VRVGGDDEPDAAVAGEPDPARLQIEAMRVAVDLDRSPRLGDHVEDLLDTGRDGWA
jgi:hypothetical protein